MNLAASNELEKVPNELAFLCAAIKRAVEDLKLSGKEDVEKSKNCGQFKRERKKSRMQATAWYYLFEPEGLESDLKLWGLEDKIAIGYIRRKALETLKVSRFEYYKNEVKYSKVEGNFALKTKFW